MRLLIFVLASNTLLAAAASAQVVIGLGGVIGPGGTNAASVAGLGFAVNTTGVAQNSGLTTLVAPTSPSPVAFDFNTGFADSADRSIGSLAGAGNVFADRKYDSSTIAPLVLDLNDNGLFDDAAQAGFGMHSDTFITFDLAVVRSGNSLAAGTPFRLTGHAGLANPGSIAPTSGAILLDGNVVALFDWGPSLPLATAFDLTLAGSGRYLTFAGLTGTDFDNFFAHVGFANVQLEAIPEPATVALVGAGLALIGLARIRRSRSLFTPKTHP